MDLCPSYKTICKTNLGRRAIADAVPTLEIAENSIKIATYTRRCKWLNVEAAGIEPASRYVSVAASTCVADCLDFACGFPCRLGLPLASREWFLALGVPDSDPGRFGIGEGVQRH